MIILGIDTALRTTGYGVIEVDGKRFIAKDCGIIKNKPKVPVSECLRRLAGGIGELVELYQPDIAAIEGTFYAKNAKTSMLLGMAKGSVVATLAQAGIPVYEYAPRKAKQIVVGNGGASKDQVATLMANMLKIDTSAIPHDASDAMALAVCHALMLQTAGGLHVKDPI
jgi:crossover junction endodeoxyribonuclease RuvC